MDFVRSLLFNKKRVYFDPIPGHAYFDPIPGHAYFDPIPGHAYCSKKRGLPTKDKTPETTVRILYGLQQYSYI